MKLCGWTHKWYEWEMVYKDHCYLVTQCRKCGKVKHAWHLEEVDCE
jgi:hypothetical protein